jgi:hypothetical protein
MILSHVSYYVCYMCIYIYIILLYNPVSLGGLCIYSKLAQWMKPEKINSIVQSAVRKMDIEIWHHWVWTSSTRRSSSSAWKLQISPSVTVVLS